MRLLVFAVLCVALMVVDARFDSLKPVRSQMGLVLTPFYWLADLPVRAWKGATEQISSSSSLVAENEKLKAEALLLQRRLQKLATLTEQNVRLRELLNSAALVDDRVIVAELIGLDPNPFTSPKVLPLSNKAGEPGRCLRWPAGTRWAQRPDGAGGGSDARMRHAYCC
ncbi:hypothetical protein SSTU70S_04604 [Stutzerimonas stutzeri]